MTDENEPTGPEFNPTEFFEMLRKQASVKAGAIMFGEAQTAYWNVLKKDMPEQAAYNLLAHTTSEIVRAIPNLITILIRTFQMNEAIETLVGKFDERSKEKEVPGSDS